MIYRELKKLLNEHGFNLEFVQTSGNLDMLDFTNPNVEGEIHVDFSYDAEIPQDIIDGREFSYDEDWVLDIPIASIDFNVDVSIAFLSEDVLDVAGSEYENRISLFGKDIELAEQVLDIITDPFGVVNFIETYATKQIEFFNQIKPFLPILKKYGLTPQPQKRSGDESTLYPSLSMYFLYRGNNLSTVDFFMRVLSWEKEINMSVEPGFAPSSGELNIDISVEDFEEELKRQIEHYDEFYKKHYDE